MKYYLSILTILSFTNSFSQNVDWVKPFANGCQGRGIGIDNQKNVYSFGNFLGTVDMDPGIGVFTLTATSNSTYIQKLDPNGNFLWAKQINNTIPKNMSVDGNGNLYIIGEGGGIVLDYDPGPATYTISNTTSFMYVLKLDANGLFVWAKHINTSNSIEVGSSAIDANGNIIISGNAWGTTDFDPGTGTVNLTASAKNIFVLKLNSAGNYTWAKLFTFGSLWATKVVADGNSNVYISNSFRGSVDADPSAAISTITSNNPGYDDIFVIKLNSNGIFSWSKNFGSNGANPLVSDMTIDKTNNFFFLTGKYSAINDFDPSSAIANLAYPGGIATFIAKYDLNGNYKWAKGFGIAMANGTTSYHNNYIKADNLGGVTALGTYSLGFDADPNIGTNNIIPNGSLDTYIFRLDSIGSFVWGGTMGGTGDCYTKSIDIDNQGNIYYTGNQTNTVDFDPSPNNLNIAGSGAFVSKIQGCNHNAPDICLVTVDSLALNNVIYWDKSLYNSADTFIVYRYDAFTTNYLRIGAKSINQSNFLIDTSRTIGGPNGGNPQYSSYRYKLAIKSTCGTIGTKGLYHESIFIQQNNQNFSWNAYGIEGQSSPATGYQFMRDNTNIGNWQVLVNTGGLSTTDPNYASYPNGNWRVDALGFSCNPTAKVNATVNRSKSNVKNNFVITSANELELKANISISPVPAKSELTVNFSNHQQTKTEYTITDVLGKVILKSETSNNDQVIIPLNDISSGVYFLNIKQGKLLVTKKFVKE